MQRTMALFQSAIAGYRGRHLDLQLQYLEHSSVSFEGNQEMVAHDSTEAARLLWMEVSIQHFQVGYDRCQRKPN